MPQTTQKPRQAFNSFVIWGPFIAAMLTILEAHLAAEIFDSHFGSGVGFKAVLGMVIITIPFTISAYIVGFLPALLTSLVFNVLIQSKLMLISNNRSRYAILGGLAGLLISIAIPIIAILFETGVLFSLFAIVGVVIPTSIVCADIEYKKVLRKKSSSM